MAAIRSERIFLEIIACSVEDARNAEAGGADRLEIARDIDSDGLTPAIDLVERIRHAVSIPLHVMIRSRDSFSDFSAKEIDQMQAELRAFEEVGVDGVVLGFLSRDGKIDFETMKRVLNGATNLSITFHRAFDRARELRRAARELIEFQTVNRILTSGGASSAPEGKEVLAELQRVANGHVTLIAGGSVTAANLPLLARYTGIREFHVGRGVRTPPTHEGIVDPERVFQLSTVAKTAIQ